MDKKIERIELKLKSENKRPLSGWQLQEFVNNTNKSYTKLDLINEVSRLLNEGEKPENIIIINKSYEINNNYTYLKKSNEIDLNKVNSVEKFYNLGRPISLYPNEKIIRIRLIFNLYEKLFSIFRLNKIIPISKNNLQNYTKLAFYEAMEYMEEECNKILNLVKGFDKKDLERLQLELIKYINDAKVQYNSYKKDELNIENFNDLVNTESSKLNDDEKLLFKKMDKQYYKEFFKYFRSVDRPIILKYHEESNKLSVIKKEYMLNDIESENFLDYKDYSHNSPFVITIIAGVAIASIIYLLYEGIKQEQLNDKEKEGNIELEDEINSEVRGIIKDLANSNELNQVNDINNNYLKNKFLDAKERVKRSVKTTLQQKGVMNKNMVVKIEDFINQKEAKKSDFRTLSED